jgi:hypothetical protein
MSADSVANPLTGAIDADQLSNTPNVQCSASGRQLNNGSWSAGIQMTKSVYAKLISGSPYLIFQAIPYNPDGTFATYENATFNLSTGLVSSTSGTTTTASMVSLGNGWYRCIQTFTPPNPGNQSSGIIAGDSIFIGGYGSTSISTTQALYGGQLEIGGSATTLEITSDTFGGSTVDSETGALTTTQTLTETGTASETEDQVVAAARSMKEWANTNLVDYSQDGTQWGLNTGTTIISTAELAPDGTYTAVRVRPTVNYSGVRSSTGVWLHDTQMVGSAWVKVDTGTQALQLGLGGGGLATNITATTTWTRVYGTLLKSVNYNDTFLVMSVDASHGDFLVWGMQV